VTLLYALYIVYGRIFSKNFDLPKLNMENIKFKLSTDEENLHKSLIHLRDKIFAHSDASMNHIQICMDSYANLVTVSSHNTTLIEKHHDVASSLFTKILNAVEKRINELLKDLYSKNNGYKITDKNFVILSYSNDFLERYHDKK
jgi:hypothetical protein